MSLKILQIGTLGPMARIIIKETEVMAIRFNPVGKINLHGKTLGLLQSVRKMNSSSRKSKVENRNRVNPIGSIEAWPFRR